MKKLFAIVMSVLMIACFMPAAAFASGGQTDYMSKYVAANGDTVYQSLEQAISEAGTSGKGTEITLLKDVTVENLITHGGDTTGAYNGQLWIMKNDITIDMAGHNITFENGNHFAVLNNKLTLKGEGVVQEKEAKDAAIKVFVLGFGSETTTIGKVGDSSVTGATLGKLEIGEDVTVKGYDAIEVNKIDMETTSSYVAGANIVINGTLVGMDREVEDSGSPTETRKDAGAGIIVSGAVNESESSGGSLLAEANCGTISITLGDTANVSAESGHGNGIVANGYAEWILGTEEGKGPTITAENAISAKSGKFTIESGSYKSTGEYEVPAESHNDGAENAGAAINLLSNDSYLGQMDVTIKGGTFTSENGNALYEGIGKKKDNNTEAATASKVKSLAISGGTFTGAENKDAISVNKFANFAGITGGNYSDFSALAYTGSNAAIGLTGSMTVDKDVEVKKETTLSVAKDQTLTVSKKLTVKGKLAVAGGGSLVIGEGGTVDLTEAEGTFENNTAAESRTLRLEEGATLQINEGGKLSSKASLNDICNFGEMTINAGGVITVGENSQKITYIGGADTDEVDAAINLTSGSVVCAPNTKESFADGYTYTLNGEATASGIKGVEDAVTPFEIVGKDKFVVSKGSVLEANALTLKGENADQLKVEGALNGKPAIGKKSGDANSVWTITNEGGTYSFDPYEYVSNEYVTVKTENEDAWTVEKYTAKAAGVTVAPLHDTADEVSDEELAKGYTMAYNEDGSITINIHPQLHANGATPPAIGKWIGIAITKPDGAKSVKVWRNDETQANKEDGEFDGKISYYWNYSDADVTKIKYQFDDGPEYTLNIKVNATPVSVGKAPLSDESEEYTAETLNSKVKTVEYKDGVATINHTKLLVHKKDDSFGKWVGFTVPADYVAEAKNSTYLYYKVDSGEWQSVELEDVLDKSKKNVCFYFDADKVGENGIAYEYAFGTSEKAPSTTPAGVNALKVLLKGTEECSGAHTFGEWTTVTAATCAAEGEKSHTCTKCDYVETQKTPKIAHTYEKEEGQQDEEAKDKVEVLTAPTCEETGTGIKTCTVCSHTEKVTIEATGHTEVVDAAKAATCTETGLTEGKHCSVCNKVLTDQNEIAKLAHTLTKTDAKTETCTEDGNCAYWTCSVCKGIFGDEACENEITEGKQIIPALGHTMIKTEAKEVTCTEDGNNAYWTCETCKKVFSDEEGQTETNVEAQTEKATGHELTHAAAKEATSSAEGNYEYWYCKNCEKYFKDEKAETEYEKDAWKIAKKSSSTSGGSSSSGGGGGYVAPSNTTNTNGTTTTTTKPSTTTVGGVTTTSAALSTSDAASLVAGAVTGKSTNIVINAATGTAVKEANAGTKTEITIPADAVSQIVEKTDAGVTIRSDVASVTLDKAAVEEVAAKAGTAGNVKLIVNTVAQDDSKVQLELKLETANGEVSDFGGGSVSVTVKLGAELAAKDVVCVYINEDGVYQKVSGTKNADGTFTFLALHFSSYAVMPAEDAEKVIEGQAEKAAELTSALSLKASSEKTAKGGVKVTLTVDEDSIKAIEDLGYTVKYKFYRSTKKAASYQAKYEKAEKTYTNTKGTKGTKYYYKARVMVYDEEGTLVAKSALKQCRYACRTFSK